MQFSDTNFTNVVKKNKFIFTSYLLVEPVSTCNLRCPFCFQSDKSFTKKPYMGVMDFGTL